MTSVLISGASVAGPVLAFWLRRAGLDVTVVEQAPTVRGGGYPIDLRGPAVDVVERMGLLDAVRTADVGTRALTFVSERGTRIASLGPAELVGERGLRTQELCRGDLTRLLWEATRDGVEYVFDDRVTALDDRTDGVDVTFRRGGRRRFDLVVGADGLHSGVRRLVFGPEERHRVDLNACYAAFTAPNLAGVDREAVVMSTPGRAAVLYAVHGRPDVTAVLSFSGPTPTLSHRDTDAQRRLVEHVFGGVRWHVPELLEHMRRADDFWFDPVSQIRMPSWSRGRVVLVGDAAHAPSFRSGQGTGIAVVGAYLLAHEIATHPHDLPAALPAYEARMRGFAERNQDLALTGGRDVSPETALALRWRNVRLRALPVVSRFVSPRSGFADVAASIELPGTLETAIRT